MTRLAIETSTMTHSVAVERDGRVVAHRAVTRRAGHATTLLQSIEGCLEDAQTTKDELQAVLCGLGPGPFTGVRVGLAAAIGLGAGLGIPVGGVLSFYALLATAPAQASVAIALDARKNEVYAGGWTALPDGRELIAPHTSSPDAFFRAVAAMRETEPILLLGDGPSAYPDAFAPYGDQIAWAPALQTPEARHLFAAANHGLVSWKQDGILEPLYIRPSDAELNPRYAQPKADAPK